MGTSVALSESAVNTILADNIIWGDKGVILSLSDDSFTGFQALYNLYYRGAASSATLVSWGGVTYTTLADWKHAEPTLNTGSREGNPDFVDIAGADGVLGGPDTPIGGGKDDNFTPGKGSPAIDASDAFLQMATDMLGQARHDDPATKNTGIGPPVYNTTSALASAIPAGALITGNNMYNYGYVTYDLPFNFTFYGVSYSTIYISSDGAIFFSAADANNSNLVGAPRWPIWSRRR